MRSRQPTTVHSGLRRYPVGVEVIHSTDGPRAHARVWAPDRVSVELVAEDDSWCVPLASEENGYFSAFVGQAAPGSLYRLRLDHADRFPDPASRFQPDGPHGPSMVVDPTAYQWGDGAWEGVQIRGQVIYELHIGTFSPAGTYRGAIERLPDLVDIGVTVIEVMPLSDFAGRFGWGYDGVNFFAPTRLYGTPDDLRAFIDAAHRFEIGVILDVVYNHFGPEGNYLQAFARSYLGERPSEWGDAPNFDGEDSDPVREYIVTNARYWIEEFHFDGLRIDATQQIFDKSDPHIIRDIRDTVHAAAPGRGTIVVAENEPQHTRLVRSRDVGGYELDAMWSDDFHHSAIVAATGRNEAYFSGFRGSPQEFISAAKYGLLYQGQWFRWQKHRRGTSALDLGPDKFIAFIQNHDQVANTPDGKRLHQETSPARCRALTALLLLVPQTPMLFQGQEFWASAPFLYFADLDGALAETVRQGRTKFVSQFVSVRSREWDARITDPADPWNFLRCKLDWTEREKNAHVVALHRDLIRIRREDPVIRRQERGTIDGAVLGDHAFALRYFDDVAGDRLLVINLGARLHADPLAEPLIVPPWRREWRTLLSTDSPEYGGWGSPPLELPNDGWWLPPETALLLAPTDDSTPPR